MLFQKLTIVLVLCSMVLGLKLPGSCPRVPPGHSLYYWEPSAFTILLGVPFSVENIGNFFVKYKCNSQNNTDLSFTVDYYSSTKPFYIQIFYRSTNSPVLGVFCSYSEFYVNKKFNTYAMESSIKKPIFMGNIDCLSRPPISSNVTIWCDKDFLIFWSCVNGTDDDHDEAVLMVKVEIEQTTFSTDLNADDLKKLKTFAVKYLPDSLMSAIDWSYDLDGNNSVPFENPFSCPDTTLSEELNPVSKKYSTGPEIRISHVAFLVVVAGIGGAFMCFLKFNRRNQVEVI